MCVSDGDSSQPVIFDIAEKHASSKRIYYYKAIKVSIVFLSLFL